MEPIKLIKSPVVFNEVDHTYTLGNKIMSGVTSILRKYLFADMYNGVSDAILKKAAAKGTLVHSQIQMHILGMPYNEEEQETIACKALLKERGIKPIESEYLISDNRGMASSIDMVDSDFNIYDFKTTTKLNIEYLRWQLSIYANLFELQNAGLQVNKMYAIHLRGDKAELVEIKRFPASYIASLFECFYSGASEFVNPHANASDYETELMNEYLENEKKLKEHDSILNRQEEIKKILMARMEESGDTDLNRDKYTMHYTPSSTYSTVKFDADAFKKEHEKMYNKYIKSSDVTRKGSLTIKIKE